MREDIWRLAGLLTAGFLAGWLLGHPALGLAIALAIYCYLLVCDARHLYAWLHENRNETPRLMTGPHDDLLSEVKNLRYRHRQREERLSQLAKNIQQATSALPDAILILNRDDGIEWANQQATDYLGIRWPQDAGQRLGNLIRHPQLIEYLKQQGLSGDASGVSLPSPEDSNIRIEYRVMPYGDGLRLLVARDVSRIHQINQMRRDFIANASHELRTPLTVIAGYLESMEGDIDSSGADLQPQFGQMRKQAARMQTLIEDLLTLSSLETQTQERHKAIVNVPDVLASIHKEAITLSGESHHSFFIDVDHDLHIRGDHKELYSAFSNLIMNAVQYTPAAGVIRIRWYEDEAGAHMKVSDTGEGISAEHIPRLTERFYRVDRARSRESGGTGLGLAIVKHVMQRHHGQLHIDSKPGKGSIFRCDFPTDSIGRGDAQDRNGR